MKLSSGFSLFLFLLSCPAILTLPVFGQERFSYTMEILNTDDTALVVVRIKKPERPGRVVLLSGLDLRTWSDVDIQTRTQLFEDVQYRIPIEGTVFFQISQTTPSFQTKISGQNVIGGSSTGDLAFAISDVLFPASDLVVSALSADESLVASSSFVFGGSGENRTISFTPSSTNTGTVTITITVTAPDGVSSTCAFNANVTTSETENALDPAAFATKMIGRRLSNTSYLITSATRFDWNGELGNWTYSKTGGNTATIQFTYDEDGNDPGIYREEVILTFSNDHSGSFTSAEYLGNVLAGSGEGLFDLDQIDPGATGISPGKVGFDKLTVGEDLTNTLYQITSSTRFIWNDDESGNWTYSKTGPNTGTVTFTYDLTNNDPLVYREVISLTFSNSTQGTFIYREYFNNELEETSDGVFDL